MISQILVLVYPFLIKAFVDILQELSTTDSGKGCLCHTQGCPDSLFVILLFITLEKREPSEMVFNTSLCPRFPRYVFFLPLFCLDRFRECQSLSWISGWLLAHIAGCYSTGTRTPNKLPCIWNLSHTHRTDVVSNCSKLPRHKMIKCINSILSVYTYFTENWQLSQKLFRKKKLIEYKYSVYILNWIFEDICIFL